MSIVNKIESISNHLENAYNSLEDIGIDLTNVNKNIENLSTQIESVYNDLPKVTDEDTEITLSPTRKGKMELTLKGNTEQFTTTGKNKMNLENFLGTEYGLTVTQNDEFMTINGTATANRYVNLNQLIGDGSTYTLSVKVISGTGDGGAIQTYVPGQVILKQSILETGSKSDTLANGTTYTNRIVIDNGTSFNNLKLQIQLEKNSTSTDWEPYTGGIASPNPDYPQDIKSIKGNNEIIISNEDNTQSTTCPINLGKNYFKNIPTTITKYGITMTNDGNTIHFSGTNNSPTFYPSFIFYANGDVETSDWYPSAGKIKTNKGFFTKRNQKYVLSYLKTGTFSGNQCTFFIGKETTYSSFGIYNGTSESHWSINKDSEKINYIAVGFLAGQTVDLELKIQIEEGLTRTDYSSYFQPLELNKIDNNYDYFSYLNDKWYSYQKIKKIVLDGHEEWVYPTQVNSSNYYRFENQDFRNNDCLIHSKYLSDKFKYNGIVWDVEQNVITNTSGENTNRLWITIDTTLMNGTTANELKTWLASNNIEISYELTTPIITEITNNTLINQLNAIKNAMSYNNQTNISQTNDNLPFIISASALKEWLY